MPAKTRLAQAGVGLGVAGVEDRAGTAKDEPQAELTAITRRRTATSARRCLSDDFFMA